MEERQQLGEGMERTAVSRPAASVSRCGARRGRLEGGARRARGAKEEVAGGEIGGGGEVAGVGGGWRGRTSPSAGGRRRARRGRACRVRGVDRKSVV